MNSKIYSPLIGSVHEKWAAHYFCMKRQIRKKTPDLYDRRGRLGIEVKSKIRNPNTGHASFAIHLRTHEHRGWDAFDTCLYLLVAYTPIKSVEDIIDKAEIKHNIASINAILIPRSNINGYKFGGADPVAKPTLKDFKTQEWRILQSHYGPIYVSPEISDRQLLR